MNKATLVTTLAMTLVTMSCGGSEPSPAQPQPTTEAPPTQPSPTEAPAWKDMNHDQKMEHMKKVVFPAMKTEFAAVDAERYGSMTCGTCHGDGATSGTFKMPNPSLPRLTVADSFKKHMDKSPEVTKFMMQTVVPKMAEMLGTHPYDPKTQAGLGCFACHLPDETPAAK